MTQFTTEDTKIIQAPWWDEDEHVVIRRFTWGDRQELVQAAVETDIVGGGQFRLGEMQLGRMNLRIMELGIKSWTLRGPEGKVVPPTRKWIYRLDEETGNFILREINAFNPRRGRSAEEQANFRGNGRNGPAQQQLAASGADADPGDGDNGLELAGTEGDAT